MFTSFNPSALGINTDMIGAITLASRYGWDACDLPIVEAVHLATSTSPDEVAGFFTESSLRFGGWRLPLDWTKPYNQTDLATLDTQAALASKLGCTRVCKSVKSVSDERPFRENFAFHVAQLRPISRILAEHGCRLGLEFIGPRTKRETGRYGFIHSLDAMLCLVEAIGPNVGLLLDSWHWYTSLGTLSDIRSLSSSEIVYVHINDAPPNVAIEEQIDKIRLLPGSTGIIDIAVFIRTLYDIGYDGPITAEPFGHSFIGLTNDQICQIAHARVRHVLNQL